MPYYDKPGHMTRRKEVTWLEEKSHDQTQTSIFAYGLLAGIVCPYIREDIKDQFIFHFKHASKLLENRNITVS